MSFEKAAVIGTGMMGPGIAITLALGGVKATIVSRSEEGAQKGLESAHRAMDLLQSHGLPVPARDLLSASGDLDASAAGVDLIVESAPEDMAFKQELFAHLDRITRPDAVLATNTSGLSITAIASKCTRPERVVTTHFWNPPHLMPLVEIVRGEKTSADVVQSMRELLARCGKTPVVVKKDTPGQLGNRLQMAVYREAMNIVEQGIADVEDVDLAAMTGFGLRLPVYGIFEHQDIVGLDLSKSVVEYVATDLYSQPRAPRIVSDLVASGNLGARTGKGYYDWSKKSVAEVKSRRDNFLLEMAKRRAKSTGAGQ
jgi:3-hydroxybutyryl-CoA dehydrogenase